MLSGVGKLMIDPRVLFPTRGLYHFDDTTGRICENR